MSAIQRNQDTSVALLQRLVLANFASPAGLTRQQLEELTGLSRTVVAGLVATLVERGELVKMRQSPVPGLRGRPPARYQRPALLAPVLLIRLVRDGNTAACLVSGDNTSGAVVDCAPWWQNWGDWSRSVAQVAKRLSDPTRLPPRAAVVSLPFPVADGHGAPSLYGGPRKILKMARKQMPPQPHWLDFDRQRELSYLLGCTALPVNDANLAALGEARFGPAVVTALWCTSLSSTASGRAWSWTDNCSPVRTDSPGNSPICRSHRTGTRAIARTAAAWPRNRARCGWGS